MGVVGILQHLPSVRNPGKTENVTHDSDKWCRRELAPSEDLHDIVCHFHDNLKESDLSKELRRVRTRH